MKKSLCIAAATGILVVGGALGLGGIHASALVTAPPVTTIAGDNASSAEFNVDDGQVENIDNAQVGEEGVHEDGATANDNAEHGPNVSSGDTGTSGDTK